MKWSHTVVSDSLWPHGLYPNRILRPWDFLGKNTGVGCHFLLQGIFLTQGLNLGFLHYRQLLYHLSHQGSPSSQSYGFSSSHVWMWELDHKENWAPKNGCFWTVVLEKTLESPVDCKEIRPVNPKGNQTWIFIGRTDAEAEAPILKQDWRLEEKAMTNDEMVGWHHRFDGHELEWAPGVSDGQGSLACYSLWGRKELDMTKRQQQQSLIRYVSGESNNLKRYMCSSELILVLSVNLWKYIN